MHYDPTAKALLGKVLILSITQLIRPVRYCFEDSQQTKSVRLTPMSTIEITLEANSDGTLHLPVPPELRQGKLKVTAMLEPIESVVVAEQSNRGLKGFGCLKGKIWMAPDFDAPLEDFKEYME